MAARGQQFFEPVRARCHILIQASTPQNR
jgi:hypothetical protein